MKSIDDYFKMYSDLYQFEEGSPEYLIDKEDFKTAMKEYASQVRDEDRKELLKHTLVIGKHPTNELSTKVAYPHCDGWEIKVDGNSIINAPKLELK